QPPITGDEPEPPPATEGDEPEGYKQPPTPGDTLLERYRRALERISEHEVEEPAQIAHDALHPKKSTTLTGALHSGSKLPHG
ncbi:hypothetical protein LCGC14_2247420, partial [marine sediment metagenome]